MHGSFRLPDGLEKRFAPTQTCANGSHQDIAGTAQTWSLEAIGPELGQACAVI